MNGVVLEFKVSDQDFRVSGFWLNDLEPTASSIVCEDFSHADVAVDRVFRC